MSDPTPLSKDPVSLDDLKRAIDVYESDPASSLTKDRWRANAWHVAFEWREEWHTRMVVAGGVIRIGSGELLGSVAAITLLAESDEGMRLIREKLQS